MRITQAVLTSQVLGELNLREAGGWEMDFANGVLVANRTNRDEEAFIIPESQIHYMRTPRETSKAMKKVA